ncbi:MAG: ROK family protein [Verrucomicrobiota bacterium]
MITLAADFGGTTIKYGLVREGGLIARGRMAACADRPMTERLEAVANALEALLKENGVALCNCKGAALALPFLVHPSQARVLGEFGKFPGAVEIDYDAWSRNRLGVPIVIENDLRMALLGEWAAGAARGRDDVAMLALGTGIGCAAMAGGRLLRGANNRAATLLGHSSIALDGAVGRCGNVGCAEDLASTATLPDLARAMEDFGASPLAVAERVDFEAVFTHAAKGDPCSQALLSHCLKVWATLVQNVILAYDPELVVLGGGVLRSGDIILRALSNHLQQHMPGLPLETPMAAAALGDDAALLGGETLFRQFLNQTHPASIS